MGSTLNTGQTPTIVDSGSSLAYFVGVLMVQRKSRLPDRRLQFESLEPRWQLAAPALTIADTSLVEGNSDVRQATFAITLSEPAKRPVTVSYATASGGAKSGSDFQARSGTVTFKAGQTVRTISVPVRGDKSIEPDEKFTVRLSHPRGAKLADGSAQGTIRNDDYPPPTASVASIARDENAGQAVFTVRVHHSGPAPVTIRYATEPGTASPADFVSTQGTLTFGPNEFIKTIAVSVNDDQKVELEEQFTLVVSLGAVTGPALAVATATIHDTDEVAPPAAPRVVGFFTSWGTYGRNYQVTDIPAEQLTHVAYAFAGISPQGTVELSDPYADVERIYSNEDPGSDEFHGNFRQLALLKAAHPQLQTLLSVGGWDGSQRFSDVAATGTSRQKFVSSVVELLATYGFDGVDLDWEFPVSGGLATNHNRPADKHNFTLLVQEFHRQFAAREAATGQHLLLTVDLGALPAQYANYELRDLSRFADWVHLMTYDYSGPWSSTTRHNSPLFASPDHPAGFDINATVDAMLAAGIVPGKLVIGAPFYGYFWACVPDVNHGMFQPVGPVPGGDLPDAGGLPYRDISTRWLPQATRYWDDAAQVPWLYDPVSQTTLSYDDPQSLAAKARYARDRGLGGMLIWELSSDDDQHSLVQAISQELRPAPE